MTAFPPTPSLSAVSSGYSRLLRAFLKLESHFGIVVAIDVASTFFALLFGVNNLIQIYVQYTKVLEMSDIGAHFTMRSLAVIVYGLVRVVLVIEVCHAVVARAEAVRWALRMEGEEVPPVCFSAAGFFTVDRRLFVSVVSVTVTYAVILWQLNLK